MPDLATGGEPIGEIVDLLLAFARNLGRDRLREFKIRAAIERREALPFDLELDGHHQTFGTAVDFEALLAEMADVPDPAIAEDRDVIAGSLLGLAVEPEAWAEL